MEFNKGKTIFLQIADMMCENILIRKWKEGDRIPSVRDMAVALEVNPNTAMRTYAYLQEKEFIYNRRGIGFFVSSRAGEKVLKLKKEEFLDSDLPQLIKSMQLLNLNFKELEKLYEKHKNEKK